MKHLLLCLLLAPVLTLVSCKTKNSTTSQAGSDGYVFDENGNYNPSFIASHGENPQVVDLTKDNPKSQFVSNDTGWAASSTKTPSSSSSSSKPTASSSPKRPTVASKPASKPPVKKPVAAARPTPKPTAKPAPQKPAPQYSSVVAQKGDTLYSFSRKSGASVAAIQAANGMGSSTIVKEGKSYKLPK